MKLHIKKHDWENYYPVHCKRCLWTGSSQFVEGGGDGPFYCPYCGMPDPTDSEMGMFCFHWSSYFGYGFKPFVREVCNLLRYLVMWAFSLATHPIRLLYARYIWYRQDAYWTKLNQEINRYWTEH